MSYHVYETVEWRAGAGTPVKYRFWIDAYLDVTSVVNPGIATIHISGVFGFSNYPLNSRNSFAASDYGIVTMGNADPWDYGFSSGTNYYQRGLPFLPSYPAGMLDSILIEFRGDTWRFDPTNGHNKISAYYKPHGLIIDRYDEDVESMTWVLNHSYTVDVSSGGDVPLLVWTTSGCSSATNYSWVGHTVWASWFDVSWNARIHYNANGGTNAPADTVKSVALDSANLTVTNSAPTWTNHRFEGWSTSSSASTATIHGGDTVTVTRNNPTKNLYAVWTEYYRPGETLNANNIWKSHQRSGGAANIRRSNNWREMRTIDGGIGVNDPPTIRHSSGWKNQRRIGSET